MGRGVPSDSPFSVRVSEFGRPSKGTLGHRDRNTLMTHVQVINRGALGLKKRGAPPLAAFGVVAVGPVTCASSHVATVAAARERSAQHLSCQRLPVGSPAGRPPRIPAAAAGIHCQPAERSPRGYLRSPQVYMASPSSARRANIPPTLGFARVPVPWFSMDAILLRTGPPPGMDRLLTS
jgi:hypothetical protein